MSILKFTEDTTRVKLKFDNGARTEGEYGVQYRWSCNEDDVFFATEQLNALLMAHDVSVNESVEIKKVKKEKIDGTFFMIFEVNGKTLDDFNAMPKPTLTAETIKDIAEPKPSIPTPEYMVDLEKRVKALEDVVGKPSVTSEDIPF